MITKIIILGIWLVLGYIVLRKDKISKIDYALAWIMLVVQLCVNLAKL